MRMGQVVRTGLGHGGVTCVLQTQFSSLRGRLMGQIACACLFVVSYSVSHLLAGSCSILVS